ncbi:hypothetical protein [Nocardioides sp.]|jgi:hypothetical protein|uniref:hypothetical protein n=1 Tax=Nocardioides sp. TaxID=35761 RepID=UPI0035121579
MIGGRDGFIELLERSSAELYAEHPDLMDTGGLIPTPNEIHEDDVALFDEGRDAGLITVLRGGRFNTLDRPIPGGHWGLLSRSRQGGWYNAEYLPQIAAYVDAILHLGYPAGRVLFELPGSALQLDLAILDDSGRVVVLGEAKRDTAMLENLRTNVERRYAGAAPDMTTPKDEARQLAWRLWTVAPDFTWLIGPNHRPAFTTSTSPLRLAPTADGRLPAASHLGLDRQPEVAMMPPPMLG